MSPRHLLLVALLTVFALTSGAGADDFDPHEQPRLFAVRDTNAARNAIDGARAALQENEFGVALEHLQEILDRRAHDFYLDETISGRESVVWRSAAEEAKVLLETLRPEGRAAYERLAGPAAGPFLADALRRRDPQALARILERYGASKVGQKAGRLRAEIAFESGDWHGAAWFAREVLRFAPRDGALWTLRVDALARAGDADALDRLDVPDNVDALTAAGSEPLADYVRRQRATIESVRTSRSRPIWGGDATRSRSYPSDPPLPKFLRWSEYTDWVERNRDHNARFFRQSGLHETFKAMLENFRPLWPAVEDRTVFVGDGRSVRAFDLYSGRTLWRFDATRYLGTEPPFRMFQPGQPSEGRTSLERAFAPVVTGDLVIATVEQRLDYYADTLQQIEISMYLPRRRLVALNRHTGDLVWYSGVHAIDRLATPVENSEAIGDWSMIAPPVVAEGLVLTVGSVYDGSHNVAFVAYDVTTGAIRWVRTLGTGQQELNLFGIPVKELAASPVTVADGVAYVGTGLGFVAAIDVRQGVPRWIASYEIIPVKPVEYWYKAPLRLPIAAPSPPLVADDVEVTIDGRKQTVDLLIVTPTDGMDIHAFDRATGRLVWRQPQKPDDAQMASWDIFVHVLGVAHDGTQDVLVTTDSVVRARRLSDGAEVWASIPYPFEVDGVIGTGAIAGREIVVPTANGLHRFALDKQGKFEGALPWPRRAESGNVIPLDRVLLVTSREGVQWFYDWEDLERDVALRRKERPDDPSILLEAGELYLRAGTEMKRARRAFEEALVVATRSAPQYVEHARHGLYESWRREGVLTRAVEERSVEAFEKALEYATSAAERIAVRIDLLGTLSSPAARIETLRALVGESEHERAIFDPQEGPVPARSKGWLLLADALYLYDQAGAAVDVLQEAIRESGAQTIGGRTVREHARRRIGSIVAQVGPGPYARHEALAQDLLAEAERSRDSAIFDRVIREFPNATTLPSALLARGAVLLQEGDADTAIGSLRQVLADYPRHRAAFPALALVARAYRQAGAYGAAKAALARLDRRDGDTGFDLDGVRWRIADFVASELAALPAQVKTRPVSSPLRPQLAEVAFEAADDDTNGRSLELATERQDDDSLPVAPVAVMVHGRALSVIDLKKGVVAWQGDTGAGVQRGASVGGRLILALTPRLAAYDEVTGEPVWTRDVDGLVRELAAGHGLVYAVVQDHQSLAGTSSLMAFDPYTGRRLWVHELGPDNPRRLRAWNGRVTLERTRWDARQSVANLLVFDGFLGELEHEVSIPVTTESQPIVADGLMVLAHRRHEGGEFKRQLRAYDLALGVERWSASLDGGVAVTAIVPDGKRIVLLQGDGHVRTFATDDGEEVHVTQIHVGPGVHVRPFMRSPLLVDEHSLTILPAPRPSTLRNPSTPMLLSFDRQTGRLLWERPFPTGADLTAARLIRAAAPSGSGDVLCAVVAYRDAQVPHILVRLVSMESGDLLQQIEPDGLAELRWPPSAEAGYGTLVVFGKAGASVFRTR